MAGFGTPGCGVGCTGTAVPVEAAVGPEGGAKCGATGAGAAWGAVWPGAGAVFGCPEGTAWTVSPGVPTVGAGAAGAAGASGVPGGVGWAGAGAPAGGSAGMAEDAGRWAARPCWSSGACAGRGTAAESPGRTPGAMTTAAPGPVDPAGGRA
ncbi:hypothetical protein ACFV3T_30935, partial [Streptomyces albidoflavus]